MGPFDAICNIHCSLCRDFMYSCSLVSCVLLGMCGQYCSFLCDQCSIMLVTVSKTNKCLCLLWVPQLGSSTLSQVMVLFLLLFCLGLEPGLFKTSAIPWGEVPSSLGILDPWCLHVSFRIRLSGSIKTTQSKQYSYSCSCLELQALLHLPCHQRRALISFPTQLRFRV